jgi:mycofactocin precursor
MKKLDDEKDENIEGLKQQTDENPRDHIFDIEEIRIEELAIDGICGVY